MVFRWQRKLIGGNKQHRDALKSGIRAVQHGYGEKLAGAVGNHLRNRNFKQALSGMVVLLKFYPKGFAVHVGRMIFRVLRVKPTIALSKKRNSA